jgi:Excalibur calcium-binding domain
MTGRPWWHWVIGAFVVLVILAVIFDDDSAKTTATPTVTVTRAAPPAQADTTTEPVAATLTDARTAADAGDYAKAVAIAVKLSPDAALAIRDRIANRIARRTLAQRRREQQAAAQAPPEPTAGTSCDPNYSGCVPPYPPDVNCPQVDGPVQVLGSDPHGLDRDKDGIACE